jgi:hypothetical protein
VFLAFVSSWLTLKELAILDTSFCNTILRRSFLFLLKQSQNTFEDYFEATLISEDVNRRRSPASFFTWIGHREILVGSLFLSEMNIVHAHQNILHLVYCAKRIFVAITSDDSIDLLVELISLTMKLELVYFFSCTRSASDQIVFKSVVKHCPYLKQFTYRSEWRSGDVLTPDVFELSLNCPLLETVDIGKLLTDDHVVLLCKYCPNLATVNTALNHQITDVSLCALANMSYFTNLNTLFYGMNRNLTVKGLIHLMEKVKSQLTVALFDCSIIVEIPPFLKCLTENQRNLTILSLTYMNHLNDESINMICSSCKLIADLSIKRCRQLTVNGAALTIVNKLEFLTCVSFEQSRKKTSKAMLLVFLCRFEELTNALFSRFVVQGIPWRGCLNIVPADIVDCSLLPPTDWYNEVFSKILSRCSKLQTLDLTEFYFNFTSVFDQLIWMCESLTFLDVKRVPSSIIVNHELIHTRDLDFECDEDLFDSNLVLIALRCPLLETVDVGERHRLTDAGMIEVANNCLRLTCVDYQNCSRLGDDTVIALARNCRNLRKLNVDGSYISDRGVAALATGCQRLQRLSKIRTDGKVTAAALEDLVAKCLELLSVCSSRLELAYSLENGIFNEKYAD